MDEFLNTIDVLGDEATMASILNGTLAEFRDNSLKKIYHGFGGANCTTTIIDLPEVEQVGYELLGSSSCPVFRNNKSVKEIYLPKAKVIYGNDVFRFCSALEILDIRSLQTMAGGFLFNNSNSLRTIKLPATPPTIGQSSFNALATACVLYIPTGSLSAYQSAEYWSTLTETHTFVEEER